MIRHSVDGELHPSLFVPFGNMQLLTDSVDKPGSMKGRLKSTEHASVEDFGKYSAYFMLCSDPDFIGKNGQNKGLTFNSQTNQRELYIFDQVFMSTENFGLDQNLNLIPTNPLSKLPPVVARHFMGRNKSVINDSSYEEKARSILKLIENKAAIRGIFESIIEQRKQDIEKCQSDEGQLKQLISLKEDAELCLKNFNKRLVSLEKHLPKLDTLEVISPKAKSQNINVRLKAMTAAHLLNNPVLFDSKGQSYRAPYVHQVKYRVNSIVQRGESTTIKFNKRLAKEQQALLKQKGFEFMAGEQVCKIKTEDLLKITEESFYDVQNKQINEDIDYLSAADIEQLAQAYHIKNLGGKSVTDYFQLSQQKFDSLSDFRHFYQRLNAFPEQKVNLGFKRHLKQKICFAIAQKRMAIDSSQQDSLQKELQSAFEGNEEDKFIQKQMYTIEEALDEVILQKLQSQFVDPEQFEKDIASAQLYFGQLDTKLDELCNEKSNIAEHGIVDPDKVTYLSRQIASKHSYCQHLLEQASPDILLNLKEKTKIMQQIFSLDKDLTQAISSQSKGWTSFVRFVKRFLDVGILQTEKVRLIEKKERLQERLSQIKKDFLADSLSSSKQDLEAIKKRLSLLREDIEVEPNNLSSNSKGLDKL